MKTPREQLREGLDGYAQREDATLRLYLRLDTQGISAELPVPCSDDAVAAETLALLAGVGCGHVRIERTCRGYAVAWLTETGRKALARMRGE